MGIADREVKNALGSRIILQLDSSTNSPRYCVYKQVATMFFKKQTDCDRIIFALALQIGESHARCRDNRMDGSGCHNRRDTRSSDVPKGNVSPNDIHAVLVDDTFIAITQEAAKQRADLIVVGEPGKYRYDDLFRRHHGRTSDPVQ
jgi:hypothetical protein